MSSAVSFFLPGPAGNLFAMYYPPSESAGECGTVLYVHPFAGEMPASRNVIASVSRDLARMGLGVLTVDLFGCGDSDGDFSDARWEIWMEDLSCATRWLQERGHDRVSLWGLRLGALLAWCFALQSQDPWERIILWEPVLSGQSMITQFLRMNLEEAADGPLAHQLTNPEQRKLLPGSRKIEIAGYELSAELIHSIDQARLVPLPKALRSRVVWVDIGNKDENATGARDALWNNNGQQLSIHRLVVPPFWMSPYSLDPRSLTAMLPPIFVEAAR